MKLLDLLHAVAEKNLTKTQLEDYHLELTSMYATLMWELADLQKQEAVFFLEHQELNLPDSERPSDVSIKRKWRGSQGGLRLAELKNYEKAVTKMLSSIKSRLFNTY